MAVLDREREVIVIRVVYDGPPEAGKTTSLRALADSLGQALSSPAEEYGRTLYFDWMDYTAGRFEGYQIRCQIVSVPGQRELLARRFRLLKDADVVVYVSDSAKKRVKKSLDGLREMARFLERTAKPPVGIIVQANKRDLKGAMPLKQMRKLVDECGQNIGLTESVASDGTGIRETFVFAVRLALDRVREQVLSRTLGVGKPDIDTSDEMLTYMRRNESKPPQPLPPPAAAPLLEQVLAENERASTRPSRAAVSSTSPPDSGISNEPMPTPPDAAVPSGSIWPPLEGRIILQEATSQPIEVQRLRSGGWTAGLANGFRIFSAAESVYPDIETGRVQLIETARKHAACQGLLSERRCIVLCDTGNGTWRLWQIVRVEKPLRERVHDIARCETDEAAKRIVDAAAVLCEIGERLSTAPVNLPCTLDTVGLTETGPVYIGLMPLQPQDDPPGDVSYAIGQQLGSIIRNELKDRQGQVLSAVARCLFHEQGKPHSGRLLDAVLTQMSAT